MQSKRVVALILGGGQGTRLFPLTMFRSKPAVPIAGKYRLIDIPISNCLHSNIKDIYVLTQFNSESLNNHVNNTYRFDYFSRAFVRILAAEQTTDHTNWFEGTADAVRKNILHLQLKGNEEILILSGDHLYEMDYRDLVAFHRKRGADFTVSTLPVRENEASDFGVLKLGRDSRIASFKEKPKTSAELKEYRFVDQAKVLKAPVRGNCCLASMGVYVFNAAALIEALKGDAADFGKEIIPSSIKTMKGYAYIFEGYWKDVGTIRSFYDVNMEMAASKPHFDFFYRGDIFTRPRFLPSARVVNCSVNHALIAEGSLINGAAIKSSIIGLRSIIGKRCSITNTVMMGADYFEDEKNPGPVRLGIGDGTQIARAIVDKNARIGRNVTIKNVKGARDFNGENFHIRDGIVIIPKGTVIPDGTVI